jgi:hypothetical protein
MLNKHEVIPQATAHDRITVVGNAVPYLASALFNSGVLRSEHLEMTDQHVDNYDHANTAEYTTPTSAPTENPFDALIRQAFEGSNEQN